MRRRDFMTIVGGAAALPLASHAQQPGKILRIGTASTQPRTVPFWRAFDQRMTELGYQEGKNYTFEYLAVSGVDEYEAGYRQIIARGVDLIIASGPELALKSAIASAGTIPIVMIAIDYDPFARGYVTSLAKPAGNVTAHDQVVNLLQQIVDPAIKVVEIGNDRDSGGPSPGGGGGGCLGIEAIHVQGARILDPGAIQVLRLEDHPFIAVLQHRPLAAAIHQDQRLRARAPGDGDDLRFHTCLAEGFLVKVSGRVVAQNANITGGHAPVLAGRYSGGYLASGQDVG